MNRSRRLAASATALLTTLAAAPPSATFTTTRPIDAVQACVTAQLAPAGRLVAINTADGVLLSLGFDSVGEDGRVAAGDLRFRIDDRGTQRRLSASAARPADEALAQDMLAGAARACLGEGMRG